MACAVNLPHSADDRYLSRTLIFRRMPQPRSSEDYCRWFYSRWGRDNAIVNARTRLAEYPTFAQAPSIKCARFGVEHYLSRGVASRSTTALS